MKSNTIKKRTPQNGARRRADLVAIVETITTFDADEMRRIRDLVRGVRRARRASSAR